MTSVRRSPSSPTHMNSNFMRRSLAEGNRGISGGTRSALEIKASSSSAATPSAMPPRSPATLLASPRERNATASTSISSPPHQISPAANNTNMNMNNSVMTMMNASRRSISPTASMSQAVLPSPRFPQHRYTGDESDDDDDDPALGMGQLVPPLRDVRMPSPPRGGGAGSERKREEESTRNLHGNNEEASEEDLPQSPMSRCPDTDNTTFTQSRQQDDEAGGFQPSKSRESTVVVSDASPNSNYGQGFEGSQSPDRQRANSAAPPTTRDENSPSHSPSRLKAAPPNAGSCGGRDQTAAEETLRMERESLEQLRMLLFLKEKRGALQRRVAMELPDRHAQAVRRRENGEEALTALSASVRRQRLAEEAVCASEERAVEEKRVVLAKARADRQELSEEVRQLEGDIRAVTAREEEARHSFLHTIDAVEAELSHVGTMARRAQRSDAKAQDAWREDGISDDLPTLMRSIIQVTRQLQRRSAALGHESEAKVSAVQTLNMEETRQDLEDERDALVNRYFKIAAKRRSGGQVPNREERDPSVPKRRSSSCSAFASSVTASQSKGGERFYVPLNSADAHEDRNEDENSLRLRAQRSSERAKYTHRGQRNSGALDLRSDASEEKRAPPRAAAIERQFPQRFDASSDQDQEESASNVSSSPNNYTSSPQTDNRLLTAPPTMSRYADPTATHSSPSRSSARRSISPTTSVSVTGTRILDASGRAPITSTYRHSFGHPNTISPPRRLSGGATQGVAKAAITSTYRTSFPRRVGGSGSYIGVAPPQADASDTYSSYAPKRTTSSKRRYEWMDKNNGVQASSVLYPEA